MPCDIRSTRKGRGRVQRAGTGLSETLAHARAGTEIGARASGLGRVSRTLHAAARPALAALGRDSLRALGFELRADCDKPFLMRFRPKLIRTCNRSWRRIALNTPETLALANLNRNLRSANVGCIRICNPDRDPPVMHWIEMLVRR